VVLWFAGLSLVIVVLVFRDAAIDYRLVMLGALLPDVVDPWFGGARVLHTLAFSAALLGVVMLGTRGHRRLRRRLLAVPIGTFLHLVLDGMWTDTRTMWWPLLGGRLRAPLPSIDRPWGLIVAMEAAGAVALAWSWRRFRLDDPARRSVFVRTGRLDRTLIG
jgi:membrane-bound metal-dependent hydrolase YbcI (DUF457 family)